MDIESRQRTASFRLFYAGPERATKYLNLRRLQEHAPAESSALRVMHVEGGRVLGLPLRWSPKGQPDVAIDCLALSTPGRMRAPAVEDLLAGLADGIVFLPSRDDPGGLESRLAFRRLMERLGRTPPPPGVRRPVLIQDYPDGGLELDDELLTAVPETVDLERVPVSGDRGEEVRLVFDRLRDRLERHLRSKRGRRLGTRRSSARTVVAAPHDRRHEAKGSIDGTLATGERLGGWKARIDRNFDLLICLLATLLGVGAALWVSFGA